MGSFSPEKFAAKYPKFTRCLTGKRYIRRALVTAVAARLCRTALVDAAVESAIAYFKEKLIWNTFPLGAGQPALLTGRPVWEKPSKLRPGGTSGAFTDLYVTFINKVAERLEKELPKHSITERKTIAYLAYSEVNHVPQQKLHPNVMPIVVFRVAELDVKWALSEANNQNPASVADWMKVTKRIGIHDWAQGQGYFVPRIYSGQYSRLLRFVQQQGGTLEFAHLECYPNWGLDGPKYYLMGKLLWNPATDVTAVLTQFCNDLFGRANKEMKNYFATLSS
jgi:hypothetical protein